MSVIARKLVPMLRHTMQTYEPLDLARWYAAHGVPLPAPKVPRTREKATQMRQATVSSEESPYQAA